MNLTSLKVINFRNLKTKELSFLPGFNFVIAPNGSGKTNLIESIYMLSNGKSFRTHDELEILPLKSDVNFFRIAAEVGSEKKDINVEYILKLEPTAYRKSKKILKINDKPKRLKDFIANLTTISFFPNSLDIVSGSPIVRRNDLDTSLCQLHPEYYDKLEAYKKVVRQRNKLLEGIRERLNNPSELKYWNEQLIGLGSEIIFQRLRFFNETSTYINQLAKDIYSHDLQFLQIEYVSKFISNMNEDLNHITDKFSVKINESYEKEYFAGKTLYGPHLEDFKFILDSKNLKLFGSRGQQRLAAFIYRMAIGKVLEAKNGYPSILLLDDLFSELDSIHITNVMNYLMTLKSQIILTATRKEYINKIGIEDYKLINL